MKPEDIIELLDYLFQRRSYGVKYCELYRLVRSVTSNTVPGSSGKIQ